MSEKVSILNQDIMFFATNPKRKAHIRTPRAGESNDDFISLGFHSMDRRRIIVCKVPKKSWFKTGDLIKIPILLLDGEVIEDDDDALLPIVHGIMKDAATDMGMMVPKELWK